MVTTEVKENTGEATNTKKRTEIGEPALMEFLKFEKPGDNFLGVFRGETQIVKGGKDGDKKAFIIETPVTVENPNPVKKLLPTHEKLTRRIENTISVQTLEKVKKGIEIEIEYQGQIKVEGVANLMKDYKVFVIE